MKYSIFIFLLLLSCKKNEFISGSQKENNIIYEKAWKLWDAKQKEKAFVFFNKAKIEYLKSFDSIGSAKCMMNMAIIQSEFGDIKGSQVNAVEALKVFEINYDTIYRSTTLNILGTNEISLGNPKQSIDYLNKAIFYSSDNIEKNVFLNNKAIAFSKMKNSDSCLIILKNLVQNDTTNKAQYIDNFEYFSWKKDPNYNAESKMLQALQMRIDEKDFFGQNASHAHLSDFYEQTNLEKSLFHAHEMYDIATQIKSPDDQLEALEKLVKLENSTNYKKYFNTYLKLKESLINSRNSAKNEFALIRYESEKNKSALLKLEAEKTEENYHLLQRNIALILFSIAIISAIFWYKKRKKRVKQEKDLLHQENQLKIKNTELKYSKKVHDVVANGLYQVMNKVENVEDLNKEKLLNELENLYEKSRDIAHENKNENLEKDFSVHLFEMINSYSSDNQKVLLAGNNQNLWQEVSENTKTELFYVIRELLTNMKKHSKAKMVSLKIQKEQSFLNIKYTDNGIGINDLKNFKGSGIKNTENRMEVIGGEINFEQNKNGGLIIHISVPII